MRQNPKCLITRDKQLKENIMAFYEIEFDYTGSAPTASKTYNFCIEDLGYDEENVQQVSPIIVKIDGSTKSNILNSINEQLPKTRSGTTYTEAS